MTAKPIPSTEPADLNAALEAKRETARERKRRFKERKAAGFHRVELWLPDELIQMMWEENIIEGRHTPDSPDYDPKGLAEVLADFIGENVHRIVRRNQKRNAFGPR